MGPGRSLAPGPEANPFRPAHSPPRLQPAAAFARRFMRLSWSCCCNWRIKKAFLFTTDCRGWCAHGPATQGTLPPGGVPPELRAPTCSAHSVFIQPQHMATRSSLGCRLCLDSRIHLLGCRAGWGHRSKLAHVAVPGHSGGQHPCPVTDHGYSPQQDHAGSGLEPRFS